MIDKIYRGASSVAERRRDQVNTLKVFNENVTEVVKDNQYEVQFPCGSLTVSMHITLGPEFPIKEPILKVTPLLDHPWISSSGQIVHAPGLVHYSYHSDLGRIVSAIIRELSSSRPVPLNGNRISPCTSSLEEDDDNSPSASHPPTELNMPPPMMVSHEASVHIETQDMVLAELKRLSDDELLQMYQTPTIFDEFIDKIFSSRGPSENVDEALKLVSGLAEENISHGPEIAALREEVDAKFIELRDLKAQYDIKNQAFEEACEKFKPHKIQEALHDTLVGTDEEGEQLAEDFISMKLCLDKFVSQYIQQRTQFYSRKVKDEILANQLDNLEKAGF